MNAAGATTEAMHQAQREAALGKARPQERQIRLEQKILMSRSLGTARWRRRNEPLWNAPEQDYVRDSG
ncbi:hypothetical protein MES4922_260083 [Mesorhizobium ventifaucium]|uniref:Integrase n=1 Tax=Mesorhizobium ventifaucium TaxID=666020 RepID=A0ABN8JUH2_9HYPH|nr:hypothetical protein MES4922_260083 [Mesorhizobium ventifaucium]